MTAIPSRILLLKPAGPNILDCGVLNVPTRAFDAVNLQNDTVCKVNTEPRKRSQPLQYNWKPWKKFYTDIETASLAGTVPVRAVMLARVTLLGRGRYPLSYLQ